MQWKTLNWGELDREGLYALLQLRAEVFVVEQDCVYQDLDDKDQKGIHIMAWDGETCVATARVLPPGVSYSEPSIGRVVVKQSHRKQGMGRLLMGHALAAALDRWPELGIRISAQTYLESFYESLGFLRSSESYEEDGLPHCQMFRQELAGEAWRYFQELPAAVSEWKEAVMAMPAKLVLGSNSSWRAGEITHHLLVAEQATWAYLWKKVQANPLDLPSLDAESTERGLQLSALLRSSQRYAMPKGLSSPEAFDSMESLESAIEKWEAIQADGRAFVAALPNNWWGVQVFRHPLAGRLCLAMTGAFLAGHVAHHRHQLRRLETAEGDE